MSWALSSFGRAPPLQGGGDRFEPGRVHQNMKITKMPLLAFFCMKKKRIILIGILIPIIISIIFIHEIY